MKDLEKRLAISMNDLAEPSVTGIANWSVDGGVCQDVANFIVNSATSGQYVLNLIGGSYPSNVTLVSSATTAVSTASSSNQAQTVTVDLDLGRTVAGAVTTLCVQAPRTAWQEQLRDYLNGAAQVINPLPAETESTFWPSDWAALRSDWMSVQSDIANVWHAFSLAQKALEATAHGERKQQEERERTDVERHAEAC